MSASPTRSTGRGPPLTQRSLAHQVEHDEHRRRGQLGELPMAEPVEARAELGVEDRELAVKHQGWGRQPRDRSGDASGYRRAWSMPLRLMRRIWRPSL